MGLVKLNMQVDDDGERPLFRIQEGGGDHQEKPKVLDPELLIRQAFQSEPEAGMSMLFHQYYPMLCNHAVRFVSSKAIAEDIVSDIFFEFHSQQRYLHITTSFRAFLFTSVRHRSFDYVKRELHRNASLDNAAQFSMASTYEPDSIIQYEELCHDVENAIGQMPLKRRQIYIMHRFEGKKYQEIANELHLSLRTIEAHLYQAIRQIRKALQDKWLILLIFFFWI
ncbi:RNA polymerase sigma-70 factor [Emticicia sp. CRIBPO]|uniref:RNA polymerase sigma-70 factor n=1 Tax=Emticicia sp. CRIBPO TaxID=2683258 RepID=UPI00141357FD|nr:RNA polymerase sigma-70 factor [Emticicia sp. CRIBPO]NBA84439.1 RNA polymerase sigma-70 factor [Emticicia sp. CRIBPO]